MRNCLYGAGCPSEKVELPLEILNLICTKISDRMELSQPAFTIPSQLGQHACPRSENANPGRPAGQRR